MAVTGATRTAPREGTMPQELGLALTLGHLSLSPMKQPIVLLGYMGCGKSTLGKALAALMDRPFYDLDQQLEVQLGQSISNFMEARGELAFRKLEHQALLDLEPLFKEAPIIALGGGTPVFYNHMDWLNQRTTTVYLEVSVVELSQRLSNSVEDRPLLKNATDLKEFIAKHLFERAPFYLQAKMRLRSDQATAANLVELLEL